MITKQQYCKYILKAFKANNDIPDEVSDDDLKHYAFQSSKLCVALEYLGIINPSDKTLYTYSRSRGGNEVTYVDDDNEVYILSTREFISLLPDELEDE